MNEKEREALRGWLETLQGDVEFLIEQFDELPEDASDEDVNFRLASSFFDLRKHMRHVQEVRGDPLNF